MFQTIKKKPGGEQKIQLDMSCKAETSIPNIRQWYDMSEYLCRARCSVGCMNTVNANP